MSLTLHDINEQVMALLKIRAAQHGRTVDAEARDILTWEVLKRKSGSPGEKFRVIQEMLSLARGGKPFSDSAKLIRESRDNDH